MVYTPKSLFPHAALLRQAFAHCGRFSTAASRRSRARISMPLLGITLSCPLPVIALVSHCLTNKLIGRRPIPERFRRLADLYPCGNYLELPRVSTSYARLWGMYLRVTNPFATIWPKPDRSTCMPYPRRQRSSGARIKLSKVNRVRSNSKILT